MMVVFNNVVYDLLLLVDKVLRTSSKLMPNSKVPFFLQKHIPNCIFLESTEKIMKTYQKIIGQKNIS